MSLPPWNTWHGLVAATAGLWLVGTSTASASDIARDPRFATRPRRHSLRSEIQRRASGSRLRLEALVAHNRPRKRRCGRGLRGAAPQEQRAIGGIRSDLRRDRADLARDRADLRGDLRGLLTKDLREKGASRALATTT